MIDIDDFSFVEHGQLCGLVETNNTWDTIIFMRQQLYAQMMGWA